MSNLILTKSKFIHIPKCGGTAVQSILYNLECVVERKTTPNNGHLFASQMPLDDKQCFAFIRNPITWWHSFYYWNKRDLISSRFSEQEFNVDSFDKWVTDYGEFWLGFYTKILKRYLGEDHNFPTKNRVTLIGKMENLYPDLQFILDELKEPYNKKTFDSYLLNIDTLPQNDVNIQSYNREEISEKTKDIIYKTEIEIFNRFNYEVI